MNTFRHTVLLLLLVALTGLAGPDEADSACDDSVTIGDKVVRVPMHWCEHLIDSSMLATPDMLVKLPGKFSHKDYRIYLRPEARDAFVKMAEEALAEGVKLIVKSGYRSNGFQQRIIKNRLAKKHKLDDIFMKVAPPGYSEHETGMSVDLHSDHGLFAESDAYAWLKKNASRFGFVESYPKNGFLYWEPWHFCYKPAASTD